MAEGCLRLVLGDQLSDGLSSLEDLDVESDVVVMAEVMAEASYVPHHPKKIAFLFSAMRHFAERLRQRGVTVDYVELDDPANSGSLGGELGRAVARHRPERMVVTEPGEWRLWEEMLGWSAQLGLPVEIRSDDRFLCGRGDFAGWAQGRKTLRMEHFYRWMRRRSGLLMEGDQPADGRWNYDSDNRKSLPAELAIPAPLRVEPDATTRRVLDLVGRRFADHFGDLEPFWFAVTAEQAEAAFEEFIARRLPRFGDYQDAMRGGEATLFHAVIGLYLNAGLLDPLAVCARAERAWRDGDAPINAVEGFVRQVLGWREYIRGIYWLKMPGYADGNHLDARRPLPAFYWTGETDMACVREVVDQTRREAYAHHIQRLMVTGNFALLAGIAPAEVEAWYLAVYADAYEWVELPNTHGMALFADGGLLASKPYAASGKYIDRMSDHCRACRFDVKASSGDDACPFNYLYWNFIAEHAERFAGNPRMAMPLRTLQRMSATKVAAMRRDAARFLDGLESGESAA